MPSPLTLFKYTYSTILLIISFALIMGLIWVEESTKLSSEVSSVVAFVALIVGVGWLTMVEGSQGSLVGLYPVDKELYKESHPIAYMCTALTNEGDNLDRYLLGRQFMVVLTVFTVNISGGPLADSELWGLPDWVITMFLGTGLAMILFTCMVGQLNSQVNASLCMLDYINTYFAVFTVWVAMAIEFSGLLHASYLIQMAVAAMSGEKIQTNEAPRNAFESIFFWGRCLMSLAILGFCLAVTLTALFDGKTTVWEGLPPGVTVVIFCLLLSVVGLLEGMQIAFFAVSRVRKEERGDSVWAKRTCDLLFHEKGHNLPGFMIGRQLCVVSCMFFVARVVTIELEDGEENIFGVSDGLQGFLNTGMCGSIILTIVGSIAWQLVASAFPIAFLSSPFTYIFLRICLFLEATGIASGAWVLAALHKKLAGFQADEVYIGTAEERAAKGKSDNADDLHLGAGHMIKLPGFAENAPPALKKLFEKDESVRAYLSTLHQAEDGNEAGAEQESH
jgi:hypothetical protein